MKQSSPPPPQNRIIHPPNPQNLERVGFQASVLRDSYHGLMKIGWMKLFLLILILFLVVNGFFALLYWAGGAVLENAEPGAFLDAFFFSVQTFATLGYGKIAPMGLYANILSSFEVFIGLVSLALMTGLVFAKFSKPTARILFSKVAVINRWNGVQSLSFRMANERTNQVMQAEVSLGVILNEMTHEGKTLRRIHDLKLLRQKTQVFGLTWLVIHPIDAESPLYQKGPEELKKLNAEIIVSFSGIDDAVLQTIHQQYSYLPEEIVWNAYFNDVFSVRADGKRVIDYLQFHQFYVVDPVDIK